MYLLNLQNFIISGSWADNFFVANDKLDYDASKIESLKFHIESDDYFGTLATILDLMIQKFPSKKQCASELELLKNDLLYLQENYKIIKK